jgi:hypothetical protein
MIDRAEMPAVRIGQRRVRIKQSDLDSYIAARSSSGRADASPPAKNHQEQLRAQLGEALDAARSALDRDTMPNSSAR